MHKSKSSQIDDSTAESILNAKDKKGGINKPINQAPSLGSLTPIQPTSDISGANDPGWKILNLEYLPSRGKFYPVNAELTIRAALAGEIRHWSTIDESDRISVNDKLNFILEKCTRFKIKGESTWLGWQRILDIDRFYIIFRIYELTFPNQENKLHTQFSCKGTCQPHFNERLQIKSNMLNIFDFPTELEAYYSDSERCFVINSQKLNETFRMYMPTINQYDRIRAYRTELKQNGRDLEKEFLKILPYLSNNPILPKSEIIKIHSAYLGWSDNKFFAVTKIADILDKSKHEILCMACPKCSTKITSPIFLDSSFSVKNLFFISAGLNELI